MENYQTLQQVVTPQIQIVLDKKQVKFENNSIFLDADDELKEIAQYVKLNTVHNSNINVNRIKYLYTTKPKKESNKYVVGELIMRKELDKMINGDIDYFLIVYYQLWKELDIENKVIQLDKLLCGVVIDEDKAKKRYPDSREYISNLRTYGVEKVLKSSEIVDMTVDRIIEEEKEAKRNLKQNNQEE